GRGSRVRGGRWVPGRRIRGRGGVPRCGGVPGRRRVLVHPRAAHPRPASAGGRAVTSLRLLLPAAVSTAAAISGQAWRGGVRGHLRLAGGQGRGGLLARPAAPVGGQGGDGEGGGGGRGGEGGQLVPPVELEGVGDEQDGGGGGEGEQAGAGGVALGGGGAAAGQAEGAGQAGHAGQGEQGAGSVAAAELVGAQERGHRR